MPINSNYHLVPTSEDERIYLESLIREDYERCHPGDTLNDLKRRASFSKEDKGLLRDWMAVAGTRARAERLTSAAKTPQDRTAGVYLQPSRMRAACAPAPGPEAPACGASGSKQEDQNRLFQLNLRLN